MSEKYFSLKDFLDTDGRDLPVPQVRVPLPDGTHVMKITDWELKEIAGKEALAFKYEYIECRELANPANEAPKAGSKHEEVFFTGTEGGMASFNEFTKNIRQEDVPLSQILEAMRGTEFVFTTKRRKWKDKNSGEDRVSASTVGGVKFLG